MIKYGNASSEVENARKTLLSVLSAYLFIVLSKCAIRVVDESLKYVKENVIRWTSYRRSI